ncbi:thioesterase family protein [Rhizoctonia solani AG-3 Rhs1AP]|uniref:Thioesterase family protein n=1 Tax=Rhizoctonia solani AG-3 Rhs1AP TaxID=1086054 RepID=X8IWJ7_9AGAM|nr:thioesterase family protein [Rhizoctonia solani AG-3 Rhs1AP]
MAPLAQALSPQLVESTTSSGLAKHVYQGTVDPSWVVGSVPHGGYVLGLLVMASMKSQERTKHQDPIHVVAHFMQPTARSEYTIQVEVVRTGSRFSNLTANLIQNGETKVLTHMIFGTLPEFDAPDPVGSVSPFTHISPTHPLFRPIPLDTHPRDSTPSGMHPKYDAFKGYVRHASDPTLMARNMAKLDRPGSHSGGLESGAWWELAGREERLDLSMIPFFADVSENTPTILSHMYGKGTPAMWYPTMVMTVEFKRKLPRRDMTGYSGRTLGVYSRGSFLEHGRHDMHGEMWSAPSSIGQPDRRDANWKKDMRCVAITSQMALCVSPDVNRSKGEKANKAKL